MKIVKCFLTKNPCYTAGRSITVKGLMLHSVGCAQPKASVFVSNWNRADFKSACVHGFIDGETGEVYQTLPWNRRGWHCGSGSKGSANNSHIGVELCEPGCIKYSKGSSFSCSDKACAKKVVKRTYEAAVELFAFLCGEYGLDPLADGVIISHREGNARGLASAHGDPEHLWSGLGMSYSMDGFRKDVKAAMGEVTEFPDTPFTVKVLVSDLNYRSEASMSGKILGQTGKGTFTIKKVKDGWGLLKSGVGWIYLRNGAFCTIGKSVK